MKVSKLRGVLAAPALVVGMGILVAGPAMAAPAGEFNTALESGYRGLASDEYNELDLVDGDMFSAKADKLDNGGSVLPYVLADWRILPKDTQALTDARARLMTFIDGGAADVTPVPLARAQVNFDCWVQEAEEDLQPEHIEKCRQAFEAAMADVRLPEPEEPEPDTIEPIAFSVYFDHDSTVLDAEALEDIADAADSAEGNGATSVDVGGHTDSSGSDAYNDRLSRARAEVVAAQLSAEGVNAGIINTTSFGESRPAVSTGDGVRERANRRAEVVLYFGGEEAAMVEDDMMADDVIADDAGEADDIDDLFGEEEPAVEEDMMEEEAPAMDEGMEEAPVAEDEAMEEEAAIEEEAAEEVAEEAPVEDEAPAAAEEAPAEDGMAEEAPAEEAMADDGTDDDLDALFAEDDGDVDGLEGIIE